MKDKDVIIATLEFLREASNEGRRISFEDLLAHLKSEKFIPEGSQVTSFVNDIFRSLHTAQQYQDQKGFMNLDAYTTLLDYEELRQARLDATEAKREARKAIYVAIVLGTLQLGLGIAQYLR